MTTHHELVALDAKAHRYYDLKFLMVPMRVGIPNITVFFAADCEGTYVETVPADCQLDVYFANYDKLKSWGFKIYLRSLQSYTLCRTMWYYQVDPSHSFSYKHEIVRYNIITMALVVGTEDHVQHCNEAMRYYAWQFLRAWINGLLPIENFDEQEKFLDIWWNSGMDLMNFSSSQLVLMKKRLAKLKNTALPSHKIKVEDFLRDDNGLNMNLIKEYSPAIALQWCLSQEFFAYSAKAKFAVETLGDDIGGLGMGMDVDYELENVKWDFGPLEWLLEDQNPNVPVHAAPLRDRGGFWFDPSKAIDLMASERERAEQMLGSLSL